MENVMIKKFFLISLLITLLSGNAFTLDSRHQSGDILLGIDLGLGVTGRFSKITDDVMPKGNYAAIIDAGINVDYYILNWLSVSSGILVRSGIYMLLDMPLTDSNLGAKGLRYVDYARTPICLTIPVMTHVNIPHIDFLYLGAGLNLNFPVASWINSDIPGFDTKGKFFLSIPLDIGIDFVKPGKGGWRLMFRATPEFHKGKNPILLGFIWQVYNFKIK